MNSFNLVIGTTQYVAEDASMLPKVVVTSDEEDVASPSSSDTSSFVASKRSRREAGRIRVYFLLYLIPAA